MPELDVAPRVATPGHSACAGLPAFAVALPPAVATPLRIRRFVGTGIAFLPERYGPVTEPLALWRPAAGVPRATIWPPSSPAPGPKSSSWSALRDHFAIVLDDQQRVAQVAEFFERAEQPAIVARVQADRRLVEHVEHAAQAAADLAGQANALRFAAGERRRRPGRACRYSSPTSTRNCRRLRISRISSPAIFFSRSVSFQRCELGRAACPAAGGRFRRSCGRGAGRPPRRRASRLPPQAEHSTSSTKCSSLPRNAGRQAARLLPAPGRGPCIGSGTAGRVVCLLSLARRA